MDKENFVTVVPKRCQKAVREESLMQLLIALALFLLLTCLCLRLLKEGQEPGINLKLLLGFLGFFCLFFLYRGVQGVIAPSKHQIAQHVMQQWDETEITTLSEIYEKINQDLEFHGKTIGKIVIGDEWMLCKWIMKLDHIRGFFCYPKDNRNQLTLFVIDQSGKELSLKIMRREDLHQAYQLLCERYPEIPHGMTKREHNTFKRSKGI